MKGVGNNEISGNFRSVVCVGGRSGPEGHTTQGNACRAKGVFGAGGEGLNEYFPDSSDATYTSHYDPEANICYAHITQLKKRNGDTEHQELIVDAFENMGYAVFYEPSPSRPPTTCTVTPLDKKDAVECTSKAEFDALVHRYYNLDN